MTAGASSAAEASLLGDSLQHEVDLQHTAATDAIQLWHTWSLRVCWSCLLFMFVQTLQAALLFDTGCVAAVSALAELVQRL